MGGVSLRNMSDAIFFIRFSRWVALTQVSHEQRRSKTKELAQRVKSKNSAFDAINAGTPERRRTFA